jgi:ABC-type branched-subunit amino acid transport system substrate-binding protein
VGKTQLHDSTPRRACRGTGRALCGLLGGSLLAGTVAVGGGAFVMASPAGAQSSATCPEPTPPTAAQNASTTGVTPHSITVGNVSIISGPVPGLFQGASIGVKAYFAMVNAHGGVNGRKLLVDAKDDAFSSSQNGTETQQAIASDFALVGSFSLFDGYGCAALAADTAVPDVSVTLDQTTNALPNDFSVQPIQNGIGLGPINWYKKHYPKDTKLGAVVSDVASAKAQWAAQLSGLESQGYKLGYVHFINPLQTDFTADVINMRNAGVNAVDLTDVDWQVAAEFVSNATTQGWHPGLIFSGGPVYADQFVSHAGGPAATNGIQIGQVQALYLGQDSGSVPAVKQFNSYVKKVNSSWVPDLFTLYGWASADLFVQALQAAGPNPTRGAVIAQLKKITSFGAHGLMAAADPAAKKPSSCFLMAQIKNGNFVREDPKGSGYDCKASFYYVPGSGT